MRTEYALPAPDAPITVALFSSSSSYQQAGFDLHGEAPPSRFGYYRPARRTLVVNLSHGAGPLRHELTHALTAALPAPLPLWLDEGLASMHEACAIRASDPSECIKPQDNWRLETLLLALAEGRLSSLGALTERGKAPLARDRALFYAHARYYCMYLHERGCLKACLLKASQSDIPPSADAIAQLCGFASSGTLENEFRLWLSERGLATSQSRNKKGTWPTAIGHVPPEILSVRPSGSPTHEAGAFRHMPSRGPRFRRK